MLTNNQRLLTPSYAYTGGVAAAGRGHCVQCTNGELHPELYRSGLLALEMGVEAGPKMTPECAVVKMMLVLAYRDLSLTSPLAGEL